MTSDPTERGSMRRIILSTLLALVLILGWSSEATTDSPGELIEVTEKQSRVLELDFEIETVSITDPEIADVILATPRQILINGQMVGETSLIVWDHFQKYYQYKISVTSARSTEQILIRVRVAEVNRETMKELGIDWLVADQSDFIEDGSVKAAGGYGGSVQSPSLPLSIGEGVSGFLQFIGEEQEFSAIIRAVQEKGGLKLLANPDLVCLNGEEASFLVGGEIPIPIAQTSGVGGTYLTIEWKEFGVRLNFIPTVIESTLVRLNVAPEVSSLDYANAITTAGFNIPAIRSRKANTTVELNSGEVFVIGGLLSATETELVSKIPLLGSIPLLGAFFSNTSHARTETELMIIVSPEIVEPLQASEVPTLPWGTEDD
jgi:pilus assembly protein CpaC